MHLITNVPFDQSIAAQESATESIALAQQLKTTVKSLEEENQKLREDTAQAALQLQVAYDEDMKHIQKELTASLRALKTELQEVNDKLEITSSCVTGWKERCQLVEDVQAQAVEAEAVRVNALEEQIATMATQADCDKVKSQKATMELDEVKAAHTEALNALRKQVAEMKEQADQDAGIYKVKSQKVTMELDEVKAAHMEALAAARAEAAAPIMALENKVAVLVGELVSTKQLANDTKLEWKGRAEKALEELDSAKGAHEEALRGVQTDAGDRIRALEDQLAEARSEAQDTNQQVHGLPRIIAEWEDRCAALTADLSRMEEAQAMQREAVARADVLEQQLVERTRVISAMKAQQDEALAIGVNQATERLSAQHRQAMEAFGEECDARVQDRLAKQKDDEQVRHLLTGASVYSRLLGRKIGAWLIRLFPINGTAYAGNSKTRQKRTSTKP
jgi:DNA repair exonuclease SbcCD ATPase subunit